MKYYKLSGDSEPKIIGVNNGVCQGNIIWKKFKNLNSEKKITGYFSLKKLINNSGIIEPIDFTIEYVEAYKSAKMTDFFMFSPALYGISFFITKKAMDVLIRFNLPISTFIPVSIYHKDVQYQYYGFYVALHYREDALDFSQSLFYEGIPYSFKPKKYLKIKNVVEYKNFNGLKSAEKLKFNEKFDTSLDLFEMIWGGNSFYISENLKEAIKQVNLTGIVIQDPKEPQLLT